MTDEQYGYGEDSDGIQQIPPYSQLRRDQSTPTSMIVDRLVQCNKCGSVIVGDVFGQTMHDVWHKNLDYQIECAAHALPQRYKGAQIP